MSEAGSRKPRAPSDPNTSVVGGRRPVAELLKAGTSVEKILIAREAGRSSVLQEIRRLAAGAGVPVKEVGREAVDALAGPGNQGVAARTGRWRYASLDEIVSGDAATALFLDGVTDPQNLGSLIRSAAGAGLNGVVVPAHRAAPVTSTVRRVSAGAAEFVPVARVTNLGRALDEARAAGMWIVGLDHEAEDSIWTSDLMEPPVGLVLGSEEKGLSQGIRRRCDALVRIPSRGRVSSLNVAMAGAVAMFELARRRDARYASSTTQASRPDAEHRAANRQ